MAYEIVNLQKTWDANGLPHERIEFSPATFFSREKGQATDQLTKYWQSLGHNPQASCLDLTRGLNAEQIAFTGMITTRDLNPLNFVIQRHTRVAPPCFSSALDGVRFSDFPDEEHGLALAKDYFECVRRQEPIYQEINHTFVGIHRHYTRVTLPLFDGDNVVAVAYATRRIVHPNYSQ